MVKHMQSRKKKVWSYKQQDKPIIDPEQITLDSSAGASAFWK